MRHPIVQDSWSYLRDLQKEAKNAKERVWIQAMLMQEGEVMDVLEEVLIDAAKRHLDVRFTMDWAAQRYLDDRLELWGPLNRNRFKSEQRLRKKQQDILLRLQKAGVVVLITNQPSRLRSISTVVNRNHSKITIVDRTAVWIGGVNFTNANFEGVDFMVKFFDSEIIDPVATQYLRVNEQKPENDYAIVCNEETKFLVDCGKSRKSIIYHEAVSMIRNAKKEIFLLSQYTPDGIFLKEIIARSLHGIKVVIITTKKDSEQFSTFPYNLGYLRMVRRIYNHPNITLIHAPFLLHAKLLCIDGREAIFGSHNFAWTGVLFGTQEDAIHTTNETLVTQLLEFAKRLI